MSNASYLPFVAPDAVPRFPRAARHMDLFDYPPPMERLLGLWGPLSKQPFRGVTTDGELMSGLFEHAPSGAPVEAAARAAVRWLEALAPEVRAKVQFEVDSDAFRFWQNTPLILRSPQLELEELDDRQRQLALEIVKSSLSSTGYERTRIVMENNLFMGRLIDLTEVLNEWTFAVSIFGTPSTSEPWGWQIFGHHLALNCLFYGDRMVLSPVFMGLEPDHPDTALKRRMFEPHETAALDLMSSMSEIERGKAVLYGSMLTADQPPERYHPDDGRQAGGAFRDNAIIPYEGLGLRGVDAGIRSKVMALAEQFLLNLPDGPAEVRLAEVERHLDETHFAWIGQVNDVDPFYFRIHSPVALIEFDHHSGIFLANKEPERFHVHSIVRTPNGGDYGRDLLRMHYARGGHERHGHGGAHSHDGGNTFHRHD